MFEDLVFIVIVNMKTKEGRERFDNEYKERRINVQQIGRLTST